jgi:hypothetical protein
VKTTGDISLAVREGVPRSTARPRTVDKRKPDGSDKSSKKGRRQALRRTAKGLNIVYAGTITSILAGMATVIPVPFLPILCLFVAFAASISITVGHVVCLFVPDDTNAKGFIIGAVVCDLAVVGLRLFPFFLVVLSLQTLGSLLFILFLRQLAVSLKRRALADEATTLILMGCGVFALSLLIIPFGFVLALAGGLGAIIGIVLGFAFFAFGIMMLFKYLELLQHLSNAILGRQNR